MRPPPPRPTGNSNEARLIQFLYDTAIMLLNSNAPGTYTDRTTRGQFTRAARLPQPPAPKAAPTLPDSST